MKKLFGLMGLLCVLGAAVSVVSVPSRASGGSGGGGTGGSVLGNARVVGYVTGVDYVNSTISVGASYYGTGTIKVTSSTKMTFDNVNCDLSAITVGNWADVRYDSSSGTAVKISASTLPAP